MFKIIMIIWLAGAAVPTILKSSDEFADRDACVAQMHERGDAIVAMVQEKNPNGQVRFMGNCLTEAQEPAAIKEAAQMFAIQQWKDAHPGQELPESYKQKPKGQDI